MAKNLVPTFYLYGEPHRLVGEDFIHVESLDDRSRPSDWTIKPHSHAELIHLFAIGTGGGSMRADGRDIGFGAPCLLLVPAMTVHGFEWLEESSGAVLTMATRYVAELARLDPDLAAVFGGAAAVPLDERDALQVEGAFANIRKELSWSAPGHRAAVDASVLSLLVIALRHRALDLEKAPRPGQYVATVAKLREMIERRFRLREPVSTYAAALGVSETALRAACAKVAGSSPTQMLDQRALLEARRSLLYSNASVAEIGFSLGFGDPAYFSRFFTRNLGMSPRRFRDSQCASD